MALYEGFINIPKSSINKYTGFSLDIGGSLVKLAYVDTVQDPAKGDYVRINLVTYHRDNLNQALEHLKEHCLISDVCTDPPEVTTTGVGCNQYSDKINSVLHIKQQNITETICFVKAFCHLNNHMPFEDITHPVSPGALAFLAKSSQQMNEMKRRIEEEKYEIGMEMIEEQVYQQRDPADEVLPCLLLMAGSGAAILKIEKDGTHTLVDFSTRCGRMFLGLGWVLTGAKDFEELISFAAAGDSRKVDITGGDLKTKDEGDIYSTIPDDMLIYCFGKGTNGGKFEPEDLARSLLSTICQDLAQIVTLCSHLYDVKRVFVCGSFADSHDVIREELTKYFLQRMHVMNMAGKTSSLDFVKFGGYLGVIGALLTDMLK